jgi:hypothetical protein
LAIIVSGLESFVGLPLLQKQAAQGFQVVQDSATGGHVVIQFRQVSGDKLEGLLTAFWPIAFEQGDVRIDVTLGFNDRFNQQVYKLLCAFNGIKWSLSPVSHTRSSWPFYIY